MIDDERLLEVPGDEDENVGDVPKKKIKRKKSKEERMADRRVIFWTLITILAVTIFFWLWPKLKNIKLGWPSFSVSNPDTKTPKPEWKNYVEYRL